MGNTIDRICRVGFVLLTATLLIAAVIENGLEIGVAKIDNQLCNGLAGTHNSLCYRVHEIEKHFHNSETWWGKDGGDNYLNRDSITPWRLTAGTGEAYGTEVQLSNGDEIQGGDTDQRFDLHELLVTQSSANDQTYKVEFWVGTSTFGAAELLTEVVYRAGGNATESQPIVIMAPRKPCNYKIWARLKCTLNSATMDIMIGVHTYSG